MPEVELVTRKTAKEAGTAAAEHLTDSDLWKFVVPDDEKRREILARYVPHRLRRTFVPLKSAWTTDDLKGAAMWLPPGRTRRRTRIEKQVEKLSLRLWTAGEEASLRGRMVNGMLGKYRPIDPHWYLETLAISRDVRNQGYRAALIEPGLERCDADGVAAYVETPNHGGVEFFRGYGFEVVGKGEQDDRPSLWMLWRKPR